MNKWNNILDEDILKPNINFAAMFVLNYECLKDFVINQIREFYTEHIYFDGDKLVYEESTQYKTRVRGLDSNIENASLKWFMNSGVITQEDYDTYQKIRKRRNEIIHEFMKNLNDGFEESDIKLFAQMVSIYTKMDKWWINEIEIPTSAEYVSEDYDRNGVIGGQAIVLSIINSIILEDKGREYKKLLEELSQKLNLE